MQEIHSSNSPVVTGICDPNKSGARHHRNKVLGITIVRKSKKRDGDFIEHLMLVHSPSEFQVILLTKKYQEDTISVFLKYLV